VVGISAFGEAGFKDEMLKAGATDLLDKTDAINALVPSIKRCVAERRS
jgi:FixJ family two-component response regulator